MFQAEGMASEKALRHGRSRNNKETGVAGVKRIISERWGSEVRAGYQATVRT